MHARSVQKGGVKESSSASHEILKELVLKYDISKEELIKLLEAQSTPRVFIPISILNHRPLGILESTVKYLHENINLTFSQISQILERDPRTVWTSYHKASKKEKEKFVVDYTGIKIPIEVLSSRKLGTLESIVTYLREEKSFSFAKIGSLLKRSDRTIWTVYQRAKRKHEKS